MNKLILQILFFVFLVTSFVFLAYVLLFSDSSTRSVCDGLSELEEYSCVHSLLYRQKVIFKYGLD